MSARALVSLLLSCTAAWLAGDTAHAQSQGSARALFSEARELAREGRYAEACPKFEASARLDRGMGTLFNLADCYENLGRTASAWSLFVEVATAAKQARMSDREQVARERARYLEPRLTRIALDVSAAARVEGLEISLDGAPLRPAVWGTPVPVDPGIHTLDARAPGHEGWSRHVSLASVDRLVSVRVPELRRVEASSPAVQPHEQDSPERTASLLRISGIVATSAGAAIMGIGGVLGLRAKGTYASSRNHCDDAGCDETGLAQRRHAVDQGNTATATTLVGAAVAAGGAVTWWLAMRRAARTRAEPTLDVAFAGRSLTVRGRW